jgi:hypothetical protein
MKNIIVVLLLRYSSGTRSKIKWKIEFHVSGNCEMCKDRKNGIRCFRSKVWDWHMDCGTLYLIVNEQKTDVTTIQKRLLL